MEKLPLLTAILDSTDKFCSGVAKILAEVYTGVAKILAEVGKILARVWIGAANVFDKLKPIIEVLAAHYALPQILVFLFLTAVLHHFYN